MEAENAYQALTATDGDENARWALRTPGACDSHDPPAGAT